MKHPREIHLGFLGVAAEECRYIEIVRGNFAGDFANIFLYLMDDVDLLRLEPLRWAVGPCLARKNRRVYACYCYQFFSRDYGAHFPSDVFVGAATGFAIARFNVLRH